MISLNIEPIKDNPSSLRAHGPSCSPIFGALLYPRARSRKHKKFQNEKLA